MEPVKNKENKVTARSTQLLKSPKKFSFLTAAVVAVAFGGFGVWTLLNSAAQSVEYNKVTIRVRHRTTNAGMDGIRVYVVTSNTTQRCLEYDVVTHNGGWAQTTCGSNIGGFTFGVSNAPAYYVDPRGPGDKVGVEFYNPGPTIGSKLLDIYLTPVPTTAVTVSSPSIEKGKSATLTWTHRNDQSCSSNAWSGTKLGSGSVPVSPGATTTYTVTCGAMLGGGISGGTTRSVTLTVTNPPAPAPASPAPKPSTPSSPSSTSKSTSTKKPPATQPAPAPAIVSNSSSDKSPPSKPEYLDAKTDKSKVVLTWPKSDASEGVIGYVLERSVDGLQWDSIAQNVQDTSYTDETAEPDTYYFYRVRAADEVGNQSEAAISEYVLIATTTAATKPDAKTDESKKKKSSGAGWFVFIGIVVLLAIGGVALWWYRRRAAAQYDSQAFVAPQEGAPHTAKSLKDMVMENYHSPDDPNEKH